MTKKLENIFNECVERMLRGESIESCLKDYPKEADELRPLLITAVNIERRAHLVQPRPEFKGWARVRLEGAQIYARQQKQPRGNGFLVWRQGWALALTAVFVILFACAGTAAAASDALPDEPLYPIKLTTEQVRLAFTFSDTSKTKLHTRLIEKRSLEIAAMARQGKTEQVAVATERLVKQLEKASYMIGEVEQTEAKPLIAIPKTATAPELSAAPEPEAVPEPEKDEAEDTRQLKEFVEGSTSGNIAILESALEDTPEQTKPVLQRAIEISKQSYRETPQEVGDEDKAEPTIVNPEQVQPSPQK